MKGKHKKKSRKEVITDLTTFESVPKKKKLSGSPRAFPIGNNFWTKRSKHGRDFLFADPNKLREEAEKYFAHRDAAGDYGMNKQPYTAEGLCGWLNTTTGWFRQFVYEHREKPQAQPLLAVIDWIRDRIYDQQYSGAADGSFSPAIVARKLGLDRSGELGGGTIETKPPTLNVYNTGPDLANSEDEIK